MESFLEWNGKQEESGFIDQIFFEYPNITPALAYADWLEENEGSYGQEYNSQLANYIRTNLDPSAEERTSVMNSLRNIGAWNFPNSVSVYEEIIWFSFSSHVEVFTRKETVAYINYMPSITLNPKDYLSCTQSTVVMNHGKHAVNIGGHHTFPFDPTISDKQCLLASLIYYWGA